MEISKKFDEQIKEIVLLHNVTKHYIILGEETDENFNSYLQPIKEFRDSYDHLLRIFRNVLFDGKNIDEAYIEKQFSKALGHEYRAFFDVGDWFTIVCRKAAYEAIANKQKSMKQIREYFPEYKEKVDVIVSAGNRIAAIRNAKDVGGKITKLVDEYQKVMNDVHGAMLYIRNAAYTCDND